MNKALGACGFALGLTAGVAAPALAHHSFSMFDRTKTLTWVGVVEKFDWTNPHVHIAVVVPANATDPATVGRWDIEGAAPNIMTRQGWNKNSFKPGDRITIVGNPLRDGSKGGALFYALDGSGKKLYHDVAR
jgi:hypothetical protein